jgi:hypothetical protein
MPETALPTMSMFDEVATPHSSEPSSKIRKKAKNVHLVEKLEYIFPVKGWRDALASWCADPYQPTSWSEWKVPKSDRREGQQSLSERERCYPSVCVLVIFGIAWQEFVHQC